MGVTSVAAYEGSGTKGKPYIVKNENDYATVLTSKSKSGWVYIAIGNNITITKTIIVQKGKFRIYAKDQSRTIKRSSDAGSVVNKNPSYCNMQIMIHQSFPMECNRSPLLVRKIRLYFLHYPILLLLPRVPHRLE